MLSEYGVKLLNPLWNYIYDIEHIVKKTGKRVIVWGLGRSGKFLTQLLHEKTSIEIDLYIDEKMYIYSKEIKVRRSTFLNYINNDEFIILSTVKRFGEVFEIATRYGYILDDTILNVYDKIGESYLDALCRQNEGLDFGPLLSIDNSIYNSENMEHTAVSFPNVDGIFNRIREIQDREKIKFVDLGCGKGGALVLAKMFGINDVSGVELLEELYKCAQANMRILGVNCNIVCTNVLDFKFDEYDFFYLYNPFRGYVFQKTIENIEESFKNIPRTIYIYYGNPFEHSIVIKNGIFELLEQFETDFYDPIANLYVARCDKDV